jgi:hypothetical protein
MGRPNGVVRLVGAARFVACLTLVTACGRSDLLDDSIVPGGGEDRPADAGGADTAVPDDAALPDFMHDANEDPIDPVTNCSMDCRIGCCDRGGECRPGNIPNVCGALGAPCRDCMATQHVCTSVPGRGGACTEPPDCSPATCHGCCDGQVCAEGEQSFLCGAGGGACRSCDATGTQCVNGACK